MGIVIETTKPGDGKSFPKKGQVVTVHYIGTLSDGKKFDSSRDLDKPFKFTVGKGHVITGLDEGITYMTKGQRAILTCPPEYAYGKKGISGTIPPNATLTFDIELLKIEQIW